MLVEEELVIALRLFNERVGAGAFANLFLLARQRAEADGTDIAEAIMAELRLRVGDQV